MDDAFYLQPFPEIRPFVRCAGNRDQQIPASTIFCSLKPKLCPGAGQKAAKSGCSGPVRWRTKPTSPALCSHSSFMFS